MPHKDPETARAYRKAYWAKRVAEGYWPEFNRTHKESRKQSSRASRLRKVYGMSESDYEAMFDAQQGLCAICRKPETDRYPSGAIKRLCVDHDHETGRVRALLCRSCNVALGLLGDDPEQVLAAAAYLEYHRNLDGLHG